ncbi:MAG: hypothetical protein Q9160_001632 [Pyrenula sp. 1 TL-2023]
MGGMRTRAPIPTRQFHASPLHLKPRTKNRKRKSMAKIEPYTKDEIKLLEERYTPAQMAAVKAGELAVDPEHLRNAQRRQDPWSLQYLDDLSKVDAVIDNPIRAPHSNTDPHLRLKTDEELDETLGEYVQSIEPNEWPDVQDSGPQRDGAAQETPDPLIQKRIELMQTVLTENSKEDIEEKAGRMWDEEMKANARDEKFFDMVLNARITVGKEEAERNPRSAEAPELFVPGEETLKPKRKKKQANKGANEEQEEEASPALLRLMQMTGFNRKQISGLRVKTVYDHQVTNQTRMGKINKHYMLSIAGNSHGLIGVGEGKSEESGEARIQSQYRAIRNMQPILRYEDRTIFGDVKGKVGATELQLYNRPPGFGLRCQQYIWEIARAAGISDLAAKVTRSRNPMNTVKATVAALMKQKNPEDVARARGRKMVDVRKVYYAGAMG